MRGCLPRMPRNSALMHSPPLLASAATAAAQESSRALAAAQPSQSTQESHDERPSLTDVPPAMRSSLDGRHAMDMISEEDAHLADSAPSTDEEAAGNSSPAGQPSSRTAPFSAGQRTGSGPQSLPSVLHELRAMSAERGTAAEARAGTEPGHDVAAATVQRSALTERQPDRTAAHAAMGAPSGASRQRSGTRNPFASTTSEQAKWRRSARAPAPALDVLAASAGMGTKEPLSAPAYLISRRIDATAHEESPESA